VCTEAPRGWHPPRAATALAPCALLGGQAACPRSGPPLARRDASSGRTTAYKRGCQPPCARSCSTANPEPPPAPVEATTASLGSGRPKPPASAPTALPGTHCSSPARSLLPPNRPSLGIGSRGGHHRRPPVRPTADRSSPPITPPKRTLVGPRPFPC
jgi:hypothetical protein